MKIVKMICDNIPQFLGFEERYKLFCPEKNRLRIKIDWLIHLLRGCSAEDYFTYRFFEHKVDESEYVTLFESKKMIREFNGKGERKWVEDKSLFPKKFQKYMLRKSYAVSDMNFDEFYQFFEESEQIILKPTTGFNGNGIFIVKKGEKKEKLKKVYEQVLKEDYIVEEVLEQEGWLRELNPASLNTIRVNAINIGGDVKVINAILRTGQGEKPTDNICAGGCVSEVDIKTGIIISDFYDLSNHIYKAHPKSKIVIKGENIPNWDGVLSTVKELANCVPDLGYTSWDIAVIKGNRVAVVEGNSYGNFNIQQVTGHGVRKEYQEYLKEWRKKR